MAGGWNGDSTQQNRKKAFLLRMILWNGVRLERRPFTQQNREKAVFS
jgi:hypothetical protein